MKFFDRMSFSTRVITKEGFLEAKAKVGRPGIQEYYKGVDFKDDELPQSLRDRPFGSIIRVLRPDNEVFKAESIASFESKPVTNNHPATKVVDASNVRRFQVGFSQKVEKVGNALEARILIQDKATIEEIQKGKEQISLGYDAEIDFTPGHDSIYGAYDAVQRNITGNHIALVDRARAGDNFRLQDSQSKGNEPMKTRVIDGISIELSDDGAAIFDSMKAKNSAQAVDIKTLTKQVADAKTEIESLKGELAASKSKTVTDEEIQKRVDEQVKARLELVDAAAKVAPEADLTGKSDREIRLEVIKTLGDSKVEIPEDASNEWIQAAFSTLVATAKPKARKELADGLNGEEINTADKARQKMIDKRMGKKA